MSVADNFIAVQNSIAAAAKACGRNPDDITLIAVSKMQPPERIAAALRTGQRAFGENRVQEAQERWTALRADYPDLTLHLIGPLQTNKAADAVALFDVIHTLDREKLARILAQEMERQGRRLPCFIQVNTGEEPQKSGASPAELADFLGFCRGECGLDVAGLMCIPPLEEPPALHFALLKTLAAAHGLTRLSMGMSADFEKAIPLGATHLRLGSALFGVRG